MGKTSVIYVHGKGGSAEEAEHYKPLFCDCDVIGFDYKAETPWEAKKEFAVFFDKFDDYILIANSIGAYFSMHALSGRRIKKAYFISPIVDMNDLILNMMKGENVTEKGLCEKGEIITSFGETLSYEYLRYVRDNPIVWNVPTAILYGDKDDLTSLQVISDFAKKNCAHLTIMKGGEHWFHTPDQMAFLDEWIIKSRGRGMETERLILRRWTDADAEDLFACASDPEVGAFAGWRPHDNVEESREVIKTIFSAPEAYAVCLKGDNRPIGAIELRLNGKTELTDKDDECEIGFWLAKPFWGQGIMTEAAKEILRHAFIDLKMNKVWFACYVDNARSDRVRQKCGFAFIKTVTNYYVPAFLGRPVRISALKREDWKKLS